MKYLLFLCLLFGVVEAQNLVTEHYIYSMDGDVPVSRTHIKSGKVEIYTNKEAYEVTAKHLKAVHADLYSHMPYLLQRGDQHAKTSPPRRRAAQTAHPSASPPFSRFFLRTKSQMSLLIRLYRRHEGIN